MPKRFLVCRGFLEGRVGVPILFLWAWGFFRILAFARQNGPFWPVEIHFGPFGSTIRTLATPDSWGVVCALSEPRKSKIRTTPSLHLQCQSSILGGWCMDIAVWFLAWEDGSTMGKPQSPKSGCSRECSQGCRQRVCPEDCSTN